MNATKQPREVRGALVVPALKHVALQHSHIICQSRGASHKVPRSGSPRDELLCHASLGLRDLVDAAGQGLETFFAGVLNICRFTRGLGEFEQLVGEQPKAQLRRYSGCRSEKRAGNSFTANVIM